MPNNASVPAKPRPQESGTRSASKMPASEGTCHAGQLLATPPQKYGTFSADGFGSGKRLRNCT